MKTTIEKVEEWIAKAPKEIKIIPNDCSIEEVTNTLRMVGKIMPVIITGGYIGRIEFICKEWEKRK